MDDPIIEVLGKTGKPVKIHISDIALNERVVRNSSTGEFEPYISRWYRLPGEYKSEYDAAGALLSFIKKYYS